MAFKRSCNIRRFFRATGKREGHGPMPPSPHIYASDPGNCQLFSTTAWSHYWQLFVCLVQLGEQISCDKF